MTVNHGSQCVTGWKHGLLFWSLTCFFLVYVGFEVWALVWSMAYVGNMRIPDWRLQATS